MITKNDLNNLKNIELKDCNKDELVDIRDVNVNQHKSQYEKLVDFIMALKNPYIFKVGDVAVKVKFSENGPSFQKKIEDIISSNLAQ